MTGYRTRHLSIIIAIAMLFTGAYFMIGQDAEAATKPKAPKRISCSYSYTTVTVKWSKVSRNVKGYTIYRNGKAIKSVKASVTKFTNKSLKPGTSYKYKVRAYNVINKKHWYNKKTKKWQVKKPAKKIRGKSKMKNVKVYGPYSPTIKIKTLNGSWTYEGRRVKASECPITYVLNTCPHCGAAGEKATVKFIDGKWRGKTTGKDYTEECHHCDSVDLVGWCERIEGGSKKTRYFTKYGEINKNGEKINDQTFGNHTLADSSKCIDEKDGATDGVRHFHDTKKPWIYCKLCKEPHEK